MLTRSPVPASQSNLTASPRSNFHTLHYAPVPSPRQSPSARMPAGLSRRPSTSSPSGAVSSPLFRAKKYAYVDAATQYSPMESVNYLAGVPSQPLPSSHHQELHHSTSAMEPPVLEGPRPKALADNSASTTAPGAFPLKGAGPELSISSRPNGQGIALNALTQPLSPFKRRNSQGPGSSTTPPPVAEQTLSKRPKSEAVQAKVLPIRYELVPIEDMVVLIAHMLGELIETNDPLALKSGNLTRFHSRTAPGISVRDYLNRLAKHATLTPPLLLSMVYYIDRLCALYPEFTINTLTVHRFLITAATVAAKGLSDSFWNNSTYARVGGIRVAELKLLELEFLYRVDWKIVPNPDVLVAYYRGLVERCPGYQLQNDGESDEDEDVSDSMDDDSEERSGSEDREAGLGAVGSTDANSTVTGTAVANRGENAAAPAKVPSARPNAPG